MTFKEWIIDLFKDEKGSTSIKPVVAFIGSLFLCSAMLISALSTKSITPSTELINAVMIITAMGMGMDTADKFSTKKPV